MNGPTAHAIHEQMAPDLDRRAHRMQMLVDAILQRLTDADIPYCLLRNRDAIPFGLLQWSDLDIMVPTDITRERLTELMLDLNPAQVVGFRDGLTYMFFPLDGLFLRVDFFHGEDGWLGAPYTGTNEILANRWSDHGIMVASLLHQAYLTWCNRLVRGGDLPVRYHGLIERAMHDHPREFSRLLENALGPELAANLVEIATSGRLAETPGLATRFRHALWLQAFRKNPVRTVWRSAKHLRHGLRRRARPAGAIIAIVGPDGETVSALCSAFASAPSRQVPGNYVEYEPLARCGDAVTRGEGSAGMRHWLPRRIIDQWLNALLRDRGKLARMAFIFRDGHAPDPKIDTDVDTAMDSPGLTERWARRLSPKPDMLIVLDLPEDVIRSRQPARSLDDAVRMRATYRAHADQAPCGGIIDATRPMEEMQRAVIDMIGHFTTARTWKHLRRRPDEALAGPLPASQPRITHIGPNGHA